MSNFFTPEFNNEIAPWNASLEPTKAIIPQLDANRVLTGGVSQEVNIPTLTPEAYDNIILPDAALTRMASALSTDSNSSLPDSSVDLLTGQAMSEVYGDLSKFAAGPDFVAKMNLAFGENWDAAGAKALAEGWFHGDFSDIPPVKVVSSAEIGGANGAFAAATNTIYLSKEFLTQNAANPAAVADVLLEEIGHSVDARLNVTDSPGDEGAIFAAVVEGKELSEGELQGLKSEDDTATVLLDGHQYLVEKKLNPAGSIGSFYNRNPAIAQALGRDTGDEFQFSPGKWRQNFQGGAIFHSAPGTYSVRGSLGRHYLNLGGQDSQLGLPTTEESPIGNGNWRQSFEKGTLEWLNNGTAKVTLTQNQVPANSWKAEYFNNTNLTGTPVFTRSENSNSINYDWGTGGPGNGVNNDYFSARWTGSFNFDGGDYTFKQSVDDGMKVWVDNNLIHDTWNGRNAVDYSVFRNMTPGQHTVKVEYKEWTGAALAKVSWQKRGNPGIDIQLFYPKGGFSPSEMNQMEKAAQNWERIITKDKDSSGVLKISVVKSPTNVSRGFADTYRDYARNYRINFSGPDVDINGVDYQNNIRFNPSRFSEVVNNNWLVRLAMHEIGHTLGLDHESGVSLMNEDNFKAQMTNSMYNTLNAQGYGVERTVPINWS